MINSPHQPRQSQYIQQSVVVHSWIPLFSTLHFRSLIITPIGSLRPIWILRSFKISCGLESQSKIRAPPLQLEYMLTIKRSYNPFQFEPFRCSKHYRPQSSHKSPCSLLPTPSSSFHYHHVQEKASVLPIMETCSQNTAGRNPLVAPIIIQTQTKTKTEQRPPKKVWCKKAFRQPHHFKHQPPSLHLLTETGTPLMMCGGRYTQHMLKRPNNSRRSEPHCSWILEPFTDAAAQLNMSPFGRPQNLLHVANEIRHFYIESARSTLTTSVLPFKHPLQKILQTGICLSHWNLRPYCQGWLSTENRWLPLNYFRTESAALIHRTCKI